MSGGGLQIPGRFARPAVDTEEGGLWSLMDREEARLRRSPLAIRDPALGKYLTDLTCHLTDGHCPDIRVHVMRTPVFNASMAPERNDAGLERAAAAGGERGATGCHRRPRARPLPGATPAGAVARRQEQGGTGPGRRHDRRRRRRGGQDRHPGHPVRVLARARGAGRPAGHAPDEAGRIRRTPGGPGLGQPARRIEDHRRRRRGQPAARCSPPIRPPPTAATNCCRWRARAAVPPVRPSTSG